MPKGPCGEKRPADMVGAAIKVARISVGDIEEDVSKSPGQVKGGRKGGLARALKLTDEQRSDSARLAAQARWKKS
jgi:hypothetical protein